MIEVVTVLTALISVLGGMIAGGGGGLMMVKYRLDQTERLNVQQEQELHKIRNSLRVVNRHTRDILTYLRHRDPENTFWMEGLKDDVKNP